jgi:hypothetical protein
LRLVPESTLRHVERDAGRICDLNEGVGSGT